MVYLLWKKIGVKIRKTRLKYGNRGPEVRKWEGRAWQHCVDYEVFTTTRTSHLKESELVTLRLESGELHAVSTRHGSAV